MTPSRTRLGNIRLPILAVGLLFDLLPRPKRSTALAWLAALLLATICITTASAASFTVTSPADVHDANPGDGICETATGNRTCTLRAAIEETNALSGTNQITLQPNVKYLLTLHDQYAALDLFNTVTIEGNGAIVDGNGSALGYEVLRIVEFANVTLNDLTVQNGDVTANGHGFAGGIENLSQLTLNRCKVLNNSYGGSSAGAAITNRTGAGGSGYLTVFDSVISGNSSGIGSSRGMLLVRTAISGNAGSGVSIVNASQDVRIVESTVSDNTAGGITIDSAGTLSIVNSTISSNRSNDVGGGIYVYGGEAVGLYNTTVTRNLANALGTGSAAQGGGVYVAAGSTLSAANSIVAQNEVIIRTVPSFVVGFDECGGTLTSLGNDILQYVDSTHCTLTGAVTIADPGLGPLQNNGGPTHTHALQMGSVAIDAGNTGGCFDENGSALTNDQRGLARPSGAHCDIGAYELHANDEIFENDFEQL
jgi:CSLREA domain-containing protein